MLYSHAWNFHEYEKIAKLNASDNTVCHKRPWLIISETYEDISAGKLQILRFQPPQWPHSSLTTVISETIKYLEIIYIARNESLTYISTADSMAPCLLLFTELFLKVKRSESKSAGWKRILTWNSQEEPPRISAYTLYFPKQSHWPTFFRW